MVFLAFAGCLALAIKLTLPKQQQYPQNPTAEEEKPTSDSVRMLLKQARRDADFDAFLAAEQAARSLLQENTDDVASASPEAALLLASSLKAQHRFKEALKIAQDTAQQFPQSSHAQAIVGDILVELGDYQDAQRWYAQLLPKGRSAALLTRYARLAEITGSPETAIDLSHQAITLARANQSASHDLAWFEWRLGKLYLTYGKPELARQHFQLALNYHPDDVASLAGLADAYAAIGKNADAVTAYEVSIAQRAEPLVILRLGDLNRKMGNEEQALSLYQQASEMVMEEVDTPAGNAHRREAVMVLLHAKKEISLALRLAKAELAERRDIWSFATLAQAQFVNGDMPAARQNITQALALGVRDPELLWLAGQISYADNDRENARRFIAQALEINPAFSPLEASKAKTLLQELKAN